jgi:hypothetical protein
MTLLKIFDIASVLTLKTILYLKISFGLVDLENKKDREKKQKKKKQIGWS